MSLLDDLGLAEEDVQEMAQEVRARRRPARAGAAGDLILREEDVGAGDFLYEDAGHRSAAPNGGRSAGAAAGLRGGARTVRDGSPRYGAEELAKALGVSLAPWIPEPPERPSVGCSATTAMRYREELDEALMEADSMGALWPSRIGDALMDDADDLVVAAAQRARQQRRPARVRTAARSYGAEELREALGFPPTTM